VNPFDHAMKHALDSVGEQETRRSESASNRWVVIGLLTSIALVLALYVPILRDWIADLEGDPSYSFALLLPFVAGYLAYRRLHEVPVVGAARLVRLDAVGVLVVLGGCALLIIADLSTIVFLSRLSFLIVIAGLIVTFLGRGTMRRMAFPFGILLFGLPLPALIYLPLTFKLQLLSSVLATRLLHLAGVFVVREGNILVLRNISLEVVEACAGLHSVFALAALACIVGYLFLRGPIRRILLVLSAIPIAIGLNAARITSAALAANLWGPDAAEGFAHTSMGIAIFAIGTLIILFVGRRLGGSGQGRIDDVTEASSFARSSAAAGISVLAVIAILSITFAIHLEGMRTVQAEPLRAPLAAFPLDIDNWRGSDVSLTESQFNSLGTRDVLMREYSDGQQEAPVLLHVAFYPRQQQGSTMHSPLHCIPGSGWEAERRTLTPLSIGESGRPFNANEVVFRHENDRILVLYWYLEQGDPQTSEFRGAFKTMWDSATEGRSYGCLIRFSTPITTTTENALARTSALAAATLPILDQKFLPAPKITKPTPF
jgi:exosortase D (VPLPA-CTERM-specific)